jgi:predicted DNA-binding transcriptional regulator YafY
MQRLERLIIIRETINKGRCPTVDDFCRMFEVQRRTVHEDIRKVREMFGEDIKWDAFKGGYVNRSPNHKLLEFDLNDGEVFALTLGKDMLTEYSGTAFEPVLRQAIEKICDRLPDRVKIDADDLKSVVKFKPSSIVPLSRKTFFDINTACEKQHPVEIVYYTAYRDETNRRTIHPLRLVENQGAWYVVAYCQLRQDNRLFALHRIKEYRVLHESKFEMPDSDDLNKWIESAFQLEHGDTPQECVIRFNSLNARYIRERKWHSSQQLTDEEDGSCTMSFNAARLDEVKRWVLTFGAGAEVVAPEELRRLVGEEFRAAAKLYDAGVKCG